jgi:hypothetical protein
MPAPPDERNHFFFRTMPRAILSLPSVKLELSVSTNLCGTCSLCCKIKAIEELGKPMYTWCVNCDKSKGCRVHDTPAMPPSCAEYNCLWHATQSFEDPSRRLPLEFRPDRTKVVVDVPPNLGYKAACFWVDPSAPAAMRSEQNRILVQALSHEYLVVEARGRKRKILSVDPVNARRLVEMGRDMSITEWEV